MTMLDKLLSFLFTQYETGSSRRFGSWFSTWWGQKMLGTTAEKGLADVRKDLRSCYYDLPIDRRPPRKEEDLKEWMADSKLVMPTRVTEERFAGQGQFLLSATLTFLFCAMAWGVTALRGLGAEGAPAMSGQGVVPAQTHGASPGVDTRAPATSGQSNTSGEVHGLMSPEERERKLCEDLRDGYPDTWEAFKPECKPYLEN